MPRPVSFHAVIRFVSFGIKFRRLNLQGIILTDKIVSVVGIIPPPDWSNEMWVATLDSPESLEAECVVTGSSPEEAVARLDEITRDGDANDNGLSLWTDPRDGKRYVVPADLQYPLIGRCYLIGEEFPMADLDDCDEALESEVN